MGEVSVELGFVEKREAQWLTNRYFPSKVGGKPAWLDLCSLPTAKDLACLLCKKPMILICQIYAPFEDEFNFHRMVYLFGCREVNCNVRNCAKNLKVFRSQLPLKNPFFSAVPPDEMGSPLPPIEPANQKLCNICGCLALYPCTVCRIMFCSNFHHNLHCYKNKEQPCDSKWNSSCASSGEGNTPATDNILLPEMEIVMEASMDFAKSSSDDDDETIRLSHDSENIRMLERNLSGGSVSGSLQDVPAKELEKYTLPTLASDAVFQKFRKVCTREPDQVIRYYRNGGEPLWITTVEESVGCQLIDIPNCEICQTQRKFEFQLMPQMLNHFEKDDIDWGTILVYTCPKSCDIPAKLGYVREFVVKQDI